MAPLQHFRSALNGFNRQDVVNYIEYLNNQHNAKVEQLNTQLQTALSNAASSSNEELQSQLDAALARCAQLEQQLAQSGTDIAPADCGKEQELEAYRRAERAERLARDRAQQIYTQANAVLADATAKAESAADQIGSQLQQCQETLSAVQESFRQTVAALYAIRPEED